MNTCKTCRHARRPLLTEWQSAKCASPRAVKTDPVSGEAEMPYCSKERSSASCGAAGVNFSPAPMHRRLVNACRGAAAAGFISIILLSIAANVVIIAGDFINYLKGLTP